ncbi:hypothetical protein BJ741DRAFT_654031, partial [Chytriomyces cf. hyalinus JEL632]
MSESTMDQAAMASLSEAVSISLSLSGPPSASGPHATSGLPVPSELQAEDPADGGPPKKKLVPTKSATTHHSDAALPPSAGPAGMDATQVATFTMVKTTKAGAAVMAKATGHSSTSGTTSSSELTKLPAYADAGEFTSWMRQYLLLAEQKFGSGEELYIPKDKRGATVVFHPVNSRPVEPETTAQFDARHTTIAKALEDMYQQQHDVVMNLATQAAISTASQATGTPPDQTTANSRANNQETIDPENMEVDTPPVLNLEVEKLKLEQARHKVESNKRLFDKEARTHSLIRAGYDSHMRVFKNLHQAHAKWVSFLKEHLDVMHSQTTLSGKQALYEMLDSLFVHCNSKDFASMTSEWNTRWANTAQQWPVKQVQWSDLRERYFTIHGGHNADRDRELACIFKARLMETIPNGDREFGPLLLAIQADRTANSMNSAEVLQQINECMSDKALLKPTVKAKLAGEKRPRESSGNKQCSV